MTELVSKAEFSKICGLSRSAVTQACNKSLKEAMVGQRVDMAHTLAVAYKKKALTPRVKPDPVAPKQPISASSMGEQGRLRTVDVEATDVTAYLDMTLRDVVARFGTDEAFKNFLSATKIIEDIHDKRLRNAEKAGELISREAVKSGLIDTINTTFIRMLSDGSKTIAVRAKASLETGETIQDIELMVADQLGSFIRPAKAKMARILRNV